MAGRRPGRLTKRGIDTAHPPRPAVLPLRSCATLPCCDLSHRHRVTLSHLLPSPYLPPHHTSTSLYVTDSHSIAITQQQHPLHEQAPSKQTASITSNCTPFDRPGRSSRIEHRRRPLPRTLRQVQQQQQSRRQCSSILLPIQLVPLQTGQLLLNQRQPSHVGQELSVSRAGLVGQPSRRRCCSNLVWDWDEASEGAELALLLHLLLSATPCIDGRINIHSVQKSDEDWRLQLTPEQFRILRRKGTEMAGTGEYDKHVRRRAAWSYEGNAQWRTSSMKTRSH